MWILRKILICNFKRHLIMKSIAVFAALIMIASSGAHAQTTQGRFGKLAIVGDEESHRILYKGKALAVYGLDDSSAFLNVIKTFSIKHHDFFVFEANSGGTGCDGQYVIVDMTESGEVHTPVFGTCGIATGFAETSIGVSIRMPGFMGPAESNATRSRASKQTHVFVYNNGLLFEDGKRVKAP
jgi:hypothetical protein